MTQCPTMCTMEVASNPTKTAAFAFCSGTLRLLIYHYLIFLSENFWAKMNWDQMWWNLKGYFLAGNRAPTHVLPCGIVPLCIMHLLDWCIKPVCSNYDGQSSSFEILQLLVTTNPSMQMLLSSVKSVQSCWTKSEICIQSRTPFLKRLLWKFKSRVRNLRVS